MDAARLHRVPLFYEECPGHGYITESGDANMHDCGGGCLGIRPIPNEVYEQHQKEENSNEDPSP